MRLLIPAIKVFEAIHRRFKLPTDRQHMRIPFERALLPFSRQFSVRWRTHEKSIGRQQCDADLKFPLICGLANGAPLPEQ